MGAAPSVLDDIDVHAKASRLAGLSDEAQAAVGASDTVRKSVPTLALAGQFPEAARLLAHALPGREVVWWACVCGRLVAAPGSSDTPPGRALEAAERWVADPSEDNRRAAEAAATGLDLSTPGPCAAMAAFFHGPSIAPPHVPAVPPADRLTSHMAAAAVMLAAVIDEPEKAPQKYEKFLALGFDIADGKNRWKGADLAPAATPAPPVAPTPPKPRVEPLPATAPVASKPSTKPRSDSARWDEWE